jgi:hypothetical protein
MQLKGVKRIQVALVAILVALVTLTFLGSPGTPDVRIWKKWVTNSESLGVEAGFTADNADYPPYSSVILGTAGRVFRSFGVDTFGAVKLAILLFLVLTSVLFWLWTRDLWLTVILHLSLLLNSVALGYIDIFVAPSLLLSMWAIKEKRLALFTVFYSLACLTKWQPIIIAPFLLLYILDVNRLTEWKQIPFKRLALNVLLPATAIMFLTLSVFGVQALSAAFENALGNKYLSGNALNFSWIVTHLLHVFYPASFGGLLGGRATYITTSSLDVTIVPKILFFLSYAVALVSFLRGQKTFENLVNFSLLGFLAYFIFNTGVHENHLFLATILSVILFWVNRAHLFLTIMTILMSNVNLILFYGINGTGLGFSRVLAGTVDTALLLSVVNVSFFLVVWGVSVLPIRWEGSPKPTSDTSGQTWVDYRDHGSKFADPERDKKLVAKMDRAFRKKQLG